MFYLTKPRAKPRVRKRVATDSSDGPQQSVDLVDLSALPILNPPYREAVSTHQYQPAALNTEQLGEVTRTVIAAMSGSAETPASQE